jgi:soluble lytic murein transglycosylase-like protein
MRNLYHYCLVAALLSACSADPATKATDQAANETASPAADQAAASTNESATASAAESGQSALPATSTAAAADQTADPTAGVLPEEPCQVLPAADAVAALGVSGSLQAVTNHNDIKGKCLYQTAPDAQGVFTTPLTLEWTRDIANYPAYASTKKGLDLFKMKPELVSGLGHEAFWGIESELFVHLPGGMLMVRADGNSPAEKRARNLKVARLVVPRL